MNFLEERILKDGVVKPGHILKVDSFLNHQMDIGWFRGDFADSLHHRFTDSEVRHEMVVHDINVHGIGMRDSR